MTFKQILKYICIGGAFLLPITPFIVSNSLFFPYITGKAFFFRLVVEIIFGAWVVLAVLDKKYRPKPSLLLWSASIFLFVIGLSNLFGSFPLRSFWSNFERMEGYVLLLHLFAYLIVLISTLRSKEIWMRLWNTSIVVSILIGIYGLSQLIGISDISRGSGIDATLGNSTYLAGYMLTHFFLTLWMLYYYRWKDGGQGTTNWLSIFYGSAMLVQVIVIYFTSTRGAILGLLGGLFLTSLLFAVLGKRHPRLRKISIGAIIGILVLIGGFFAIKDTSLVQSNRTLAKLAETNLQQQTVESRLTLWQMSIDGFKDRPLLGWGQDNFIAVFDQEYEPELYKQEPWFDRAHNIVMNWLVVGGALGLLAYLSIWFLLVYSIWRRTSFNIVEKSILTGLLAAYFFHNLFVFDNVVSYIFFFTFIGFIHFYSVGSKEEVSSDAPSGSMIYAISAGAMLLVIASSYFFVWKPMGTASILIDALGEMRRDPSVALAHFKEAEERGFAGRAEVRSYLVQGAREIGGSEAPQGLKDAFLDATTDSMEQSLTQNPDSVRHRLLYASTLNVYGEYERAIEVLEDALEISPYKQQLYLELEEAYMGLEQYDKAVEVLSKAHSFDPSYVKIEARLGHAHLLNGDIEQAEEFLITDDGKALIYSPMIVEAAIEKNALSIVRTQAEAVIEENKDNPQAYVSAAMIYMQIGDREEALEALRTIEDFNGESAQVEGWIREIESGGNPFPSL